MDLLSLAGVVAGVLALGVGSLQLRVAILERRDARDRRRHRAPGDAGLGVTGALPVSAPLGRLPSGVLGRAGLLEELAGALGRTRKKDSAGVWVLAGMGGVGKSTAALWLAARAQRRGWAVWWVNAADPVSLRGGVLEILRQLDAPAPVMRQVRDGSVIAADTFWRFVSGTAGRALLIFDNADVPGVLAVDGVSDPGDGTGWARSGGRVMTVVTTRTDDQRIWGTGTHVRSLKVLDDVAGAEVLGRLAPQVPDPSGEEALALARRLGSLPLALHLAGTYLASPFTRWHSFEEYRKALDSCMAPLVIAELDAVGSQTRAVISRTWEVSLDDLTSQGVVRARGVQYLLSCFAAATPIPREMVRFAEDGDRAGFLAALRGLSLVGLIEVVGAATDGYPDIMIHPVVVDTCRAQVLATHESEGAATMRAAVGLLRNVTAPLDAERPADWPAWERLIPHIMAMITWLPPVLVIDDLVLLLEVGGAAFRSLRGIGWQATTEGAALAQANATAAERLDDLHPAALGARHDLGVSLADRGAPGEAEDVFRAVLAGRRQVQGDDHVDTLRTRDQLIHAIMVQGRHDEAERMYVDLLSDMTRVLGAEHRDTLITRVDLAWSIGQQGRYAEAAQICSETLQLDRVVMGPEDPKTFDAWADLARWTNKQGNHIQAEAMCKDTLDVVLRVVGAGHPLAVSTQATLARSIFDQGRYGEAEHLLRATLADMGHPGEGGYFAIIAREYLADAVAVQGRRGEADQILRDVLDLKRQWLGPQHPETKKTIQMLGQTPEAPG
ncbi:tetratricopeptide repeat protein [Planotetraspora mira]|uniref:Tetratricopeptide repeat protein n=2 Tax=Planotetraspora mira TaxID=58121 RepID=A0A8J3U904_9ACTN|nr:hypothetical protein Pmi06nite_81820 [Planotetraspora mira]